LDNIQIDLYKELILTYLYLSKMYNLFARMNNNENHCVLF